MLTKLTIALAMASAVTAAPTLRLRQNDCQDAWNACIAAGTPEVACSCTLAACLGEDNARNREFCATATAKLPQPTAIPGGCNPAHPGSCPTTTEIPGGCNPAHPGSCPTTTAIPGGCNPAHPGSCPTTTADAGIPGGCNPAHPGSCPSPTADASIPGGCNPAHPGSCPSTAPAAPAPTPDAPSAGPQPIAGKKWTIEDVSRYCSEDNSGCDYNFKINANGKTESCTIIRTPGSDAATESWYEQPCTSTNSDIQVSWGFAADGAPPFSVITVIWGEERAWFGVNDVNGQEVTASNPFGSGQFGNIGPEAVYAA